MNVIRLCSNNNKRIRLRNNIQELSDDCLGIIIEYLSFVQQLCIRAVNQQWYSVANQPERCRSLRLTIPDLWTRYSKYYQLDTNRLCPAFIWLIARNTYQLTLNRDSHLDWHSRYLQLFQPLVFTHLQTLEFGILNHQALDLLDAIVIQCPGMNDLTLVSHCIWSARQNQRVQTVLYHLASRLHRLNLNIELPNIDWNRFVNLETLYVTTINRFTTMPPRLSYLRSQFNEEPVHTDQVLSVLQQLTHLTRFHCSDWQVVEFPLLPVQSLISLTFSWNAGTNGERNQQPLRNLSALLGLEHLTLHTTHGLNASSSSSTWIAGLSLCKALYKFTWFDNFQSADTESVERVFQQLTTLTRLRSLYLHLGNAGMSTNFTTAIWNLVCDTASHLQSFAWNGESLMLTLAHIKQLQQITIHSTTLQYLRICHFSYLSKEDLKWYFSPICFNG